MTDRAALPERRDELREPAIGVVREHERRQRHLLDALNDIELAARAFPVWLLTRQALVHRDTKREEVDPRVDVLLLVAHLLGRRIPHRHRTEVCLRRRERVEVGDARDAEVEKPERAGGVSHEVLRLYIAVDHTLRVCLHEGLEHVLGEPQHVGTRQRAGVAQHPAHAAAIDARLAHPDALAKGRLHLAGLEDRRHTSRGEAARSDDLTSDAIQVCVGSDDLQHDCSLGRVYRAVHPLLPARIESRKRGQVRELCAHDIGVEHRSPFGPRAREHRHTGIVAHRAPSNSLDPGIHALPTNAIGQNFHTWFDARSRNLLAAAPMRAACISPTPPAPASNCSPPSHSQRGERCVGAAARR
jgi:hypothetical protein